VKPHQEQRLYAFAQVRFHLIIYVRRRKDTNFNIKQRKMNKKDEFFNELDEINYNRDSDFQKQVLFLLKDDAILPVACFPFIKGKPMQTSTNRLGFPTFTIFDRNIEITSDFFEELKTIGNEYGYVYFSLSIFKKKIIVTFQSLPF
jgi:hypothetical protein